MKSLAVCLALTMGTHLCFAGPPLFNGKDLSNWEIKGKAVWTVENGIITGGQDGDPKKAGLLISKENYSDFDLSFEFEIDEHGKYNSGVYFRLQPSIKGPRLQLNLGRGVADEPVGLYLDDWLDKGDATDQYRRPGEWNHIRLKVEGARIEVWLNGEKIVDFKDPVLLNNYLIPGKIAFQTYGAEGHAGWVKFRKLELQNL
ncbi:MAG: DUF1080 domain-containing protein [Verrucomicrobiales bacterium]|nr:DUF1080 domain-containing protein [Verrucomicrobiales bacterium]